MEKLNYLIIAGLLLFSAKNASADDLYDHWYNKAYRENSLAYCDSLINYALTLKKNDLIGEAYFLQSHIATGFQMYYLALRNES